MLSPTTKKKKSRNYIAQRLRVAGKAVTEEAINLELEAQNNILNALSQKSSDPPKTEESDRGDKVLSIGRDTEPANSHDASPKSGSVISSKHGFRKSSDRDCGTIDSQKVDCGVLHFSRQANEQQPLLSTIWSDDAVHSLGSRSNTLNHGGETQSLSPCLLRNPHGDDILTLAAPSGSELRINPYDKKKSEESALSIGDCRLAKRAVFPEKNSTSSLSNDPESKPQRSATPQIEEHHPKADTLDLTFSDSSSSSCLKIDDPTLLPEVQLDVAIREEYKIFRFGNKKQVLLFQHQFRNTSAAIVVGHYEIPVHGAIISLRSRLLGSMLQKAQNTANEDLPKGGKPQGSESTPSTIEQAKSEQKLSPNASSHYEIDQPIVAVLEFLKIFYPMCPPNLSFMKSWTEVLALWELCVEYQVQNALPVRKKCLERLQSLLKRQSIEDLLGSTSLHMELREGIATCIAKRMIRGEIEGDDLGLIEVEIWNLIMQSKVWKRRPNNVDYGGLIVQVLTWVAIFEPEVSGDAFVSFLDTAAGYPKDIEAIGCFCRGVKTEVPEAAFVLVKQLRPDLQIQFWHRVSDYLYTWTRDGWISKTVFVL